MEALIDRQSPRLTVPNDPDAQNCARTTQASNLPEGGYLLYLFLDPFWVGPENQHVIYVEAHN